MTGALETLDWQRSPDGAAVLSKCGTFRYTLTRWLDHDSTEPGLTFVMLNPSTADALADDPTIRRCSGFADREGASHFQVVNLYPYRATDPKALFAAGYPLGEEDGRHLVDQVLYHSPEIVCAWGSTLGDRGWVAAHRLLRNTDPDRLLCLGTTKAGHPRHPLYVKGDQPLEPFTLRMPL